MKIIRACDNLYIKYDAIDEKLVAYDTSGNLYQYSDQHLKYVDYANEAICYVACVKYKDQFYRVYKNAYTSTKAVLNGELVLLNRDGEKCCAKPETIVSLVIQGEYNINQRYFAYSEDGASLEDDSTLILSDTQEDEFVCVTSNVRHIAICQERVIGVEFSGVIIAYDMQLNTLWTNRQYPNIVGARGSARSRTPTDIGSGVLLNIGSRVSEQTYTDGVTKNTPKEGVIACFDITNGQVLWERILEYAVDDIMFHKQKVFVSSYTYIYVLSPDTGDIIHQIHTPVTRKVWLPVHGPELHIDGDYLFFPSNEDNCLLVYHLSTYELVQRIDFPEYWAPISFHFKDPCTGDLYFNLMLGVQGAPYKDRNALLQLNPKDIATPIEIEQCPNLTVALRPAPDDASKEELWVEIHTPSLDDALRFGEWHIQNEAYIQGYSQPYHCEPNPKFNGEVHFKYSGADQSPEVIQEMLTRLCRRFNEWVDDFCVFGGDSNGYECCLTAEYGDWRCSLEKNDLPPPQEGDMSDVARCMVALESGDSEHINTEAFQQYAYQVAMTELERGESAQAHYLAGSILGLLKRQDEANEHMLKAAYLGSIEGAAEYACRLNLQGAEVLGMLKSIIDTGENIGSVKEDYDSIMEELSDKALSEVDTAAKAFAQKLENNGAVWHW